MGSQFFSGSTKATWTLSTFSIEEPAFSRDSFMIFKASAVCSRTSPALGLRSGYQPPMPPRKSRWPERIGPFVESFFGFHEPVVCASVVSAPSKANAVVWNKARRERPCGFGEGGFCVLFAMIRRGDILKNLAKQSRGEWTE